MSPASISLLEERHAVQVAALHTRALAGDFLPSLGTGFLQVFYSTALRRSWMFGFVALDDQGLAGFVAASQHTGTLFRRTVRSAGPALGLAALTAILRRPSLLLKVAETFLYPSREGIVSESAELLVIAVQAEQRGRRIGEALVDALNAEFCRRQVDAYKVTVLQSNLGANRFYQRLGFQLAGSFHLYRKGWNVYRLALQADKSQIRPPVS